MVSPESLLRKLWDSLALLNIYAMLVVVPLEIGGWAGVVRWLTSPTPARAFPPGL
jgi:hypothetical protein